ncbi:MAG: hypothetical protein JW934_21645 [Anaerolineae bacterium]|nr:hypothetical protein [Anaerolineae bacterium]
MIKNEDGVYYLRCDRCQSEHSTRATAFTEAKFKELASSWGWAFGTEHGDLCKKCAKAWKKGQLTQAQE